MSKLDAQIRDFEPRHALDGGIDGLDAYRAILSRGGGYLKPEGKIVLELSPELLTGIITLAEKNQFRVERVREDFTAADRVIVLAPSR
jgi:release factor glutamine methyltransferase